MLRSSILTALLCVLLYAGSLQADTPKVKVASISDLSGPLQRFCHEFVEGMQLAVKDLRDRKVVDIELILEDHQWKAPLAVTAFKKVSEQDGVKYIIVNGSSPTLAIKPLSESKGVFMLSLAAHPEIVKNSKNIIRHGGRGDLNAQVVAGKIKELGAQNIAMVSFQNDWAINFYDELNTILSASQKLTNTYHLPTDTDFKSILAMELKHKPDVLVVNSLGMAVAHIILQARDMGYQGPIISNIGLVLSMDAFDLLSSRHVGNLYYEAFPEPPADYLALYQKAYKKTFTPFSFFGFQELQLIGSLLARNADRPAEFAAELKNIKSYKNAYGSLEITPEGDINIPTTIKTW